MNHRYDIDFGDGERIVYVRAVALEDLPEELRLQAPPGRDHVYAVHDSDGQRLALVGERSLAFALARQNDLAPVSVH
jgi:hypothetical protein